MLRVRVSREHDNRVQVDGRGVGCGQGRLKGKENRATINRRAPVYAELAL